MKRLKTAAWWTLCIASAFVSAAMAILILGAIAAANGTAAGVLAIPILGALAVGAGNLSAWAARKAQGIPWWVKS